MNEMKYICINKNRGWRGLAQVEVLDEDKNVTTKHIFSFSEHMWNDLILKHQVVIASQEFYYVIHFEDKGTHLPLPHQQRSVLIKNYYGDIDKVDKISKDKWSDAETPIYNSIYKFLKNRNNHTTSDWNCIGVRVVPDL